MASGRSSRAKGVRGEHESADIFRRYGFEVVRLQNNVLDAGDYIAKLYATSPNGTAADQFADQIFLVDAKLRKRVDILAASRQIEQVATNGQVPAVVYRHTMPPGQRAQPWRVSLRLEDFARLLGTT